MHYKVISLVLFLFFDYNACYSFYTYYKHDIYIISHEYCNNLSQEKKHYTITLSHLLLATRFPGTLGDSALF